MGRISFSNARRSAHRFLLPVRSLVQARRSSEICQTFPSSVLSALRQSIVSNRCRFFSEVPVGATAQKGDGKAKRRSPSARSRQITASGTAAATWQSSQQSAAPRLWLAATRRPGPPSKPPCGPQFSEARVFDKTGASSHDSGEVYSDSIGWTP